MILVHRHPSDCVPCTATTDAVYLYVMIRPQICDSHLVTGKLLILQILQSSRNPAACDVVHTFQRPACRLASAVSTCSLACISIRHRQAALLVVRVFHRLVLWHCFYGNCKYCSSSHLATQPSSSGSCITQSLATEHVSPWQLMLWISQACKGYLTDTDIARAWPWPLIYLASSLSPSTHHQLFVCTESLTNHHSPMAEGPILLDCILHTASGHPCPKSLHADIPAFVSRRHPGNMSITM